MLYTVQVYTLYAPPVGLTRASLSSTQSGTNKFINKKKHGPFIADSRKVKEDYYSEQSVPGKPVVYTAEN